MVYVTAWHRELTQNEEEQGKMSGHVQERIKQWLDSSAERKRNLAICWRDVFL